ncbi:MAG: hypothetical protein H5T68_11485 [Chloroflexi bacterium]|nr:hypothetical protein [Chloroflexota bacterium]
MGEHKVRPYSRLVLARELIPWRHLRTATPGEVVSGHLRWLEAEALCGIIRTRYDESAKILSP